MMSRTETILLMDDFSANVEDFSMIRGKDVTEVKRFMKAIFCKDLWIDDGNELFMDRCLGFTVGGTYNCSTCRKKWTSSFIICLLSSIDSGPILANIRFSKQNCGKCSNPTDVSSLVADSKRQICSVIARMNDMECRVFTYDPFIIPSKHKNSSCSACKSGICVYLSSYIYSKQEGLNISVTKDNNSLKDLLLESSSEDKKAGRE